MIIRTCRCINCKIVYTWNSYHTDDNSSTEYCPECKGVINKALSTISRKFECKYISTSEIEVFKDITWPNIEAWEADLEEKRKTKLCGQRIGLPLFKMDGNKVIDTQRTRWVFATSGPHKGMSFKVSSWKDDPEKTIELGMEFDIVNNKLTGDVWVDRYPT